MKILILSIFFFSSAALAVGIETNSESEKRKDEVKQTYEGNIRGLRALMDDLKIDQPNIYRRLKPDYDDLNARQKKADTVAYVTYGVSAGFAAYGIFKWFGLFKSDANADSTFSFTPFLLSLGTSFVGGWTYYIMRPSPQEYLDFTNKHNRLNKKQQLQWDIGLLPKGASVGLAYSF